MNVQPTCSARATAGELNLGKCNVSLLVMHRQKRAFTGFTKRTRCKEKTLNDLKVFEPLNVHWNASAQILYQPVWDECNALCRSNPTIRYSIEADNWQEQFLNRFHARRTWWFMVIIFRGDIGLRCYEVWLKLYQTAACLMKFSSEWFIVQHYLEYCQKTYTLR